MGFDCLIRKKYCQTTARVSSIVCLRNAAPARRGAKDAGTCITLLRKTTHDASPRSGNPTIAGGINVLANSG